ncbi:hypothetical protein PIB30_008623 [Stylosanthes scabra]|uniref:Uncharacterized protein n=1 Tax=Stylosanthes scabra TaxID=79078 RepID=A0ABU6S657_9FABA|nr:hypothetical protein [Stylosanthes scabra]
MCQEILDICLDQVSHLCPGVDFSAITLKSRWDPKGRRIFVPQESEVEGELPSAEEVVLERHPESTAQALQSAAGDTAGEAAGDTAGEAAGVTQHRVISPVRCRGVCSDHFTDCPLD